MARNALACGLPKTVSKSQSPNPFPILMFVYKRTAYLFTSFVKMITSILYYIICFTFIFCSFYNILEIIKYIQIPCFKIITTVPVQYFKLQYCIYIVQKSLLNLHTENRKLVFRLTNACFLFTNLNAIKPYEYVVINV